MRKKLTVLSQVGCRPCEMVKHFLQDKGIDYESVNVQEHPEVAGEFGIMSTPVTILLDDNGKEVKRSAGFNPVQLEELLNELNQ
jgi:thioredoxin 1